MSAYLLAAVCPPKNVAQAPPLKHQPDGAWLS
jgi:hypothetical protein